MAPIPKISPEQWAKVRSLWELDARDGYTWIVKQLSLPVSANAVRKKAVQEGWAKADEPSVTNGKLEAARGLQRNAMAPRTNGEPTTNGENQGKTQAEIELTPYKTRETPILYELDEDEPRQGLFVREYLKDLNGTQAAIRAGYSPNGADSHACYILAIPRVQAAIRELRDELLSRLEANAEDVLRTLVNQLHADINEISQYRRVCCRHCWGELGQDGYSRAYQCSPAEYERAELKHDEERAKLLKDSGDVVDIGEFSSHENDWYDKRREPNPECPECFGEGIGEVYFGDTRKLSKAAKALYGGVKQSKAGIEIVIANREKVIDQLARVLGMFKDKEPANNGVSMTPDELGKMFWERMEKARARQRQVDIERGNIIEHD